VKSRIVATAIETHPALEDEYVSFSPTQPADADYSLDLLGFFGFDVLVSATYIISHLEAEA
jgi:hypothetical protein